MTPTRITRQTSCETGCVVASGAGQVVNRFRRSREAAALATLFFLSSLGCCAFAFWLLPDVEQWWRCYGVGAFCLVVGEVYYRIAQWRFENARTPTTEPT